MTVRRIILTETNHEPVREPDPNHPYEHLMIDASNVPHNNAAHGIFATVQEQCNLGHWHETQRVMFAPWGDS